MKNVQAAQARGMLFPCTMKSCLLFLSFYLFAIAGVQAIPVNASLSLANAVAEQSPEHYDIYLASQAIDGNFSNFTHTLEACPDPWLTVTLPEATAFTTVVIYNRQECCGERLRDITVTVYAGVEETDPLFTSELLNPDGVLGSPASLTVDFPSSLVARKVKIRRTPGIGPAPGVLSIGEVQLILKGGDVDLPPGSNLTAAGIISLTATQSTTQGNFAATNALDSNFNNFTHTDGADANAWWEADFGTEVSLQKVTLYNRSSCCQGRLRDLTITVYDANHQEVWSLTGINPNNEQANPTQILTDIEALRGSAITGRYVRVARAGLGGVSDDNNVLALGEVVFTGGTIPSVPQALPVLSLTREGNSATLSWPADTTGYLLEYSPDLADPWTPVSGVTDNAITLTLTADRLFFRLRKTP